MNSFKRKLSFSCWNIALGKILPGNLLQTKDLSDYQWMKHEYKDRCFADPFILEVDKDTMYVLAEELIYKSYKGTIVLLEIDKETAFLKKRETLLELPTHLSFPFILREEDTVYIIPESSSSGQLSLYQYDNSTRSVHYIKTLIHEPMVDAILFKYEGFWWILGGRLKDQPNRCLLVYKSVSLWDEFELIPGNPYINDIQAARPGGDVFTYRDRYYRPVQDSSKGYGSGLTIKLIGHVRNNIWDETTVLRLSPQDTWYKDGIHTLNFYKGYSVIDGNRLRFSPFKKILSLIRLNYRKHHGN